jgi:hypothetical protein
MGLFDRDIETMADLHLHPLPDIYLAQQQISALAEKAFKTKASR